MKKIFLLVLLVGFLFSGCDGIGGMQNGFFGFGGGSSGPDISSPEIDNTGSGLDVDLKFDHKNIKTGRLMYEVFIKNSGSENIELSKDNFKLNFGDYDGAPLITSESESSFYSKVLGEEGKVKLYQNMEFEQGGILKVSDEILKSKTVNNFKVDLEVSYPYETKFITNLDLDVKYDLFEIKSGSRFEQASPIQVNYLNLVPSYENGQYILEVEINDKGDRGDIKELSDKGIRLESFEINFGNKGLSCTIKPETVNSPKSSEMLVKKGKKLVLECPVTIDSKDAFVTQVSGSFSFEYKNLNTLTVNIPKDVRQ